MLDKSWWTSLEERGHWVLVVSKDEFQIGLDAWDYTHGQLKAEVQALVPERPHVVTSSDICRRLWKHEGPPSREFLKAVQRCLRDLRASGITVSKPLVGSPYLGWHLAKPSVEQAPFLPNEAIAPPMVEAAPIRRDVVVERRPLARGKIKRVPAGEAPAPSLKKLRAQVLALVPGYPAKTTAPAITERIKGQGIVPAGDLLDAVRSQLRELQLRRLVRAVPLQGSDELGWHLREAEANSK